jgi:hypothetical protein
MTKYKLTKGFVEYLAAQLPTYEVEVNDGDEEQAYDEFIELLMGDIFFSVMSDNYHIMMQPVED